MPRQVASVVRASSATTARKADRDSGRSAPATTPFAFQQQLFAAAHRLGRRTAARPPALRPLDNAGHAHPKQRRRRPACAAARNRTNHTIPQVLRIGSCHLMLAPSPSQHLESQNSKYENPLFDSAIFSDVRLDFALHPGPAQSDRSLRSKAPPSYPLARPSLRSFSRSPSSSRPIRRK